MLDAYRSPWTEVSAHLRDSDGVAILPFGAFEAHGPHLPLGTDTMTAVEVARRVADRVDAVLLPPVHYGETWLTSGYPGTISLTPATVTAIAVDIGRALVTAGAKVFAIVNGDFGNRTPLQSAARILSAEAQIVVVLDYPGMDAAIARVREAPPAAPGLHHAEEAETSTMLAIEPASVRTDRFVSEYPDFPADFGSRPILLHKFSASGVFGDPTRATAVKGEQIIAATVDGCVAAIERVLAAA